MSPEDRAEWLQAGREIAALRRDFAAQLRREARRAAVVDFLTLLGWCAVALLPLAVVAAVLFARVVP